MENIPATLQYPKFKLEWDLSLPVDVPLSILLPQIISNKQCENIDFLDLVWQIRIRDSGDFIKPEQTLGSAGILPGDILVIEVGIGNVPDFSKTKPLENTKAVLIGESQSFPVTEKHTKIGRGILPEIDLTSLDKNLKVSRLHAIITINKDTYKIRDTKSKNGTYINGEKLSSGSEYELVSGDIIRFGDGSGVVMKFQKNL